MCSTLLSPFWLCIWYPWYNLTNQLYLQYVEIQLYLSKGNEVSTRLSFLIGKKSLSVIEIRLINTAKFFALNLE
jgi:hypothetical protein